ncbi:MAG: signal recognition particle-docking protein FtsY [Alphaproteobacteria bacterium]|nr:signal recognition particle-docking protein FtsY [Alphaproteobacteria bacterium]
MSWWHKVKQGLSKTSATLEKALRFQKCDAGILEDIEDALILTDMGVHVVQKLMKDVAAARPQNAEAVKQVLYEKLLPMLQAVEKPFVIDSAHQPYVIVMVGVNGVGKTTTIAKMAQKLKEEGKKVAIGAADTFRAAAIEQLQQWGKKIGCPVYASSMGADAAATAYDALMQAKKNKDDVLFLDTAGRLQNKKELMDELQKILRVLKKIDPTAPHSVLLCLDATVGQNALQQVEIFAQMTDLSGLVMTKLDGSAKGGVLVALSERFHLPIYLIGVGEGKDDLNAFNAEAYLKGLLAYSQENK